MNEAPAAPKSRVKQWILWPVGVCLVYVLSWGPVFAMYGTGWLKMPVAAWVKDFYAPVKWMQNHTMLENPLREYLFWWARVLSPA